MLRVVVFLIALGLIAAGFAWIADRPGDILLTWQGYRVETSLMVAGVTLIALVVIAILLWSVLRAIVRTPENVSLFFRHRRAMKGHQATSRGLIAIGAGDFDELVRTLQRTLGLTVFMVTHDLDSLYTACDRIAVLGNGKIIAAGSMADMQASQHPWLRQYFHGKRARAVMG